MVPSGYWGGRIDSELTMNSQCTHWVSALSPPVILNGQELDLESDDETEDSPNKQPDPMATPRPRADNGEGQSEARKEPASSAAKDRQKRIREVDLLEAYDLSFPDQEDIEVLPIPATTGKGLLIARHLFPIAKYDGVEDLEFYATGLGIVWEDKDGNPTYHEGEGLIRVSKRNPKPAARPPSKKRLDAMRIYLRSKNERERESEEKKKRENARREERDPREPLPGMAARLAKDTGQGSRESDARTRNEHGSRESDARTRNEHGSPESDARTRNTGGDRAFTQWVHCEFIVSSESIHPPQYPPGTMVSTFKKYPPIRPSNTHRAPW
jgi:hypothetical protein